MSTVPISAKTVPKSGTTVRGTARARDKEIGTNVPYRFPYRIATVSVPFDAEQAPGLEGAHTMTSHAWTPRSGPLSMGERLMLARVADSYPRPLDTIRWITQTRDGSDCSERIGECELEMRGWLRIRKRRPGHAIEFTGRAMKECPWLADPAARAKFVAEVRCSLVPEQVERRGAMEPQQVVLVCGCVALRCSTGEVDADLRARCIDIFGAVMHIAEDSGFKDADALRESIIDGYDDLAHDLAAQVVAAVGDGLRAVLRQHRSEFLLDGISIAVSH